ncbi:secreted protein containing hyalin domain [Christiangramia forsetii KT0803]|uniref:Secreted protein containing hyalin domain n=2 Tax=Christiangramia forsetii TaxID=411153 RepID=A0M2G1_CHRFK|nr:secreted protein containing hyalin domain [Christiangramia forsetii KT0803]
MIILNIIDMIWKTTISKFTGLFSISQKRILNAFSKRLTLAFLAVFLFTIQNANAQLVDEVVEVAVPNGGFGIDGDLLSNFTTKGIGDWFEGDSGFGGHVLLNDGTPIDPNTTSFKKDAFGANDNVFKGGEKWNDDPNTWTWKIINNPIDKGDINNGMFHLSSDALGNQWMFVGADRNKTVGTAYIDFAFYQSPLTITNNGNGGSFSTAGPDGGRTINDILLTLEYSNGGDNPRLIYYLWKKVGDEFLFVEQTSLSASAQVNQTSTPMPAGAYGNTSYSPLQFIEGAVNLTAALNTVNALLARDCREAVAIKSVFIKTKSSDEDNATLKDFIEPISVDFQIGSASIVYETTPVCGDIETASVALDGVEGGIYSSTEGLKIDPSTGEVNVSESIPGNYIVSYTYVSYGCTQTTNANFEIIEVPDAPVVIESSIMQPSCETTTGSFSVRTEQGLTYSLNGGEFQNSGSFTNLEPGNYTLTAKNNNDCESIDSEKIIIKEQPNTPDAPVVASTTQPTCELATGSFTVSTTQGVEYSINGSDYQTNGTFSGLAADTYNVTSRFTGEECVSDATSVTIDPQPNTPDAPVVASTTQPICGLATGSFTVSTTQGVEYSINGSDYQTNGTFSGLAADTYNVTARFTGEECVSDATSVTIDPQPNTPDAPVVASTTQPTCDLATGSFTVSTTQGVEYSINGSDYQTNGTFSGLAADTYNVTARFTGEECVSDATSVTINEQPNTPDAPVVASTTQPTCDLATGSFTVSTTQGVEYSINGSDYQTNGTFSGLAADNYNVTARFTGEECVSDATSVTIDPQPNTPDAPVVASTTQPTCDLATGSFTVSTTQGVEYSINGSDYQTNGSFSGLAADTYNVTARFTGEECVSDATSVTIDPQPNTPDAPVVASTTQPTCDLATGSFTVSTTQGVEYSINGSDYQTNGTFSGLAADTYNVTSRFTGEECVSDATSVTIDPQPNTPDAPVVASTTQPTCDLATGSFTVSTTQGVEYSINGSDYQTNGTFSGLAADTYNVTARFTGEECVSDATSVTIDPQPNTPDAPVVASTTQPTCDLATGSFTVSTTQGVEYSINGSDYQTNGTFSRLAADTYNVTARFTGEECVSDATSVTIDPQPNTPDAPVVASTTQPTCDLATGSFTVSTTQGVEYSINGSDYQTNGTFSGLAADTYNVTARFTGEECVSDATSVTIDPQPNTPDAPVVASTTQPTCDLATGSFTVSTTQGVEYSINGSDYQTNGTFSGLAADTYNVTARFTGEECVSDATSVTIDPQPNTPDAPVVASTTQPTCDLATGSFTVSTTQGVEYSINGSDYQTNGSFSGLAADTYNVTARFTGEECVSDATSVTIDPQPNTPDAPVVVSTTQPTCELATGSFTVSTTQGVEYSINGSDYQTNGTFSGLAADTYNVTARFTGEECVSDATSVTIDPQPNTPDAPVVASTTQPTCDLATGSFTVSTTQGVEYSINGTDYQTNGTFSGLAADTYNVTARFTGEECVSDATSVTIDPQPNTPDAPVVVSTTQPTCDLATGSFTVSITQGVEYSINGTDYQTNGTFSGLAADTYNVTARFTGEECVSDATSVTINEQPETPATPTITATDADCENPGSITVTNYDNSLSYTLLDSQGNPTAEKISESGVFELLSAGEYSVNSANNDCNATSSVTTVEGSDKTPTTPIVTTTDANCTSATGSITITNYDSTLTYTLVDNEGDDTAYTQSEGTFEDVVPGTYTVRVNNDDCNAISAAASIEDSEQTPTTPIITATDASCTSATGSITITNYDSTLTYTLVDNEGDDTAYTQSEGTFEDVVPGSYTATASNNDCISEESNSAQIAEQPMGPTANDDTANSNEDTSVTINVLANDNNPEDSDLTIVSFTQTSDGIITQTDDNTFEYTPSENFNGEDLFTYTITNGSCDNSTATVTITIGGVNDAPVAVDDSANTDEDTAVEIAVLNNDSDPDNDPLSVTETTTPENGTVVINENGTITYTPNENYNGTDSFEYTITDGNDGFDSATVTITIGGVNDAPVAVDDSANTDEDTAVEIAVLNNDSDPDNDPLSVTETTTPENGTVVINENGTITYTPNENYNGTDSFEYTITDGNDGFDSATVTITIGGVNDAPVAVDDSANTDEDTAVEIAVLNNDSDPDNDPLSVTETTTPENGTVVINENGTITYTPNENYNGTDSFEYTITDGNDGFDSATVTITIGGVNDAPIAVDDSANTDEDTAVEIAVLNNDSDPDGDDLIVVSTTSPNNGIVTINENGTITYSPNDNFNGQDTFDYTIEDEEGLQDTATVTVTVNPVNDAPIALDDTATTDQDTPVIVSVLENDSDIDGGELVVTETTTPGNGEVTINTDGTVTYTPNDSFTGVDTFEYTISDGNGGTDTALVTITVNDTEGPEIACPGNMDLNNDPGICGAVVNFTIPEFTDNAEGAEIVQTAGPVPGDVFPVGTTTVEFTATDASGNSTICSFDVTVIDTEAPVLEEMDDLTTNNDNGICGAVVNFNTVAATDNCEIDSIVITEGFESGSEFPVGTTTVTYTVTDINGNVSTESFTVTVVDNEAPEISCPSNITVDTETGVSYATVDFTNATATDNCSVSVEQTGGPVSGSQFEIGTTTVTFTATDAAGNTSECSFTVTVEDNEDPTISCPSDIDLTNDAGVCGAAVEFTIPEFSDNSGFATIEQTAGLESGDVFPVGTTTVSYTVTDEAGNSVNCSFDVTVIDNEAPVLEEMDDLTTNNDNGICGAVVNFNTVAATDNCEIDSIVITEGFESGSEFPVGTTTVTYTVTDINGNVSTESFTVTVVDNEAPEISCPSNITVDTETGVSYATVDFTNATATDNCSVSVEQTGGPVSGSQFEIGTTTVTFTATDAAGNTSECSFTVTVEDNEDPTISCPSDIDLTNDAGVCGAAVEFTIPEFSDNSGFATIEQTAGLESGDVFPVGTTTVSYTVTDEAGNSANCSFDVTVIDTEAPVLEEMDDLTTNNDNGICGAVVNFNTVAATDNCEIDSIVITEGFESGSEFPVGTTTVTYTVTDINGNVSTESFTVTIVDNEAPEISCPSNMTVDTETGVSYATVDFTNATATDNCSVSVEQTGGPVSGSQFEIGTTTVTFTATDAAGNTSECSFTVTVEDNEDPTISCPSDISQNVDAGICGAAVTFETPAGFDNSGDVSVEQTAGLESGDVFPVGATTVTFTATDAAGNSVNCSFIVTVADDEAPVIEDMDNITLNTEEGMCGAVADFNTPGATDNCEVESVLLTEGLEPGTIFPVGTTEITYTATDNNGNIATTSFTVTVNDNEAPVIECPDNVTVNVENGVTSVVVNYEAVTTTDNCEGTTVEMTSGIASGEEFSVGNTEVTFTVTDASGNSTTCSFTVTVDEDPAPAPPPAPEAPEVNVTQATCAVPTGTIAVAAQEGLSYSIDGENYQTEGIFTALAPGTYDIVAQDEFGQLSEFTTVTIEDPVAQEIELANNGVIDLCTEDSTFDLFELFTGDFDDTGVWVDVNNTGALDNGFVDPSLLAVGSYSFEYQIDGNCPSTTTVSVLINDDCIVLDCSVEDLKDSISKAVTPNNDDINDFFEVDLDTECGFTYDLKIFNRWGAKVFDAKNYQNNWDGYSDSSFTSSNQLPSGTYFYVLEIRNSDFEPIQGYIYLGTK